MTIEERLELLERQIKELQIRLDDHIMADIEKELRLSDDYERDFFIQREGDLNDF